MPFDGVSPKVTILTKALERLRRDGWCQNMCQDNQAMCAGYAIVTEYGRYYGVRDTRGIPMIMRELELGDGHNLMRFNDRETTTFANIERWFENKIRKELQNEIRDRVELPVQCAELETA